ncbi:16S rRNA (guanine(966)-N(2))-methyltransferase RsmD [soil metagenome]
MSVRIISGDRRGAKLRTPDGDETRPLRDRIRQSLFNILRDDLRGVHVLDAFAGSGAVGLEALSNGAASAVFIESSTVASGIIRANINKLRYEERAIAILGSSPDAPGRSPLIKNPFDILFLMPPYHSELCQTVLKDAAVLRRCSAKCVAVVEIHESEIFEAPAGWELTDERKYGTTRLIFLRRAATDS